MKKFCIVIILLLMAVVAFSQSTSVATLLHSNVKKGDQLFDHFAYRNALEIYLHAYERNPGDYYLRERIGTCYFMLHDPKSAEMWFSSLAKETDIHPEAKFEYAEALSMTGNYQHSLNWFRIYLKDRPDDKVVQEKISFLEHVKKYTENSHQFIVTTLSFNTDHSEYGAHPFHQGVVFASSRDVELFTKHKPTDKVGSDESLLNLYYVDRRITGEWEELKHFHASHLKTHYHEGPIAFYDGYRKGAFTRSNLKNGKPVYDKNGKVNLQIYFADVVHLDELKNIVPFEYNTDDYSMAHPSFTPDGKVMYFSSTEPRGFGGSDIYFSKYDNGKWSEPVNAGPHINTREDESFPFISNDTTLYFTSNGHGTLGGLDIYVSYKRKSGFIKPVNLGSPVNTMYDDFSFVSDSTSRSGFFASNRPGGKGLDDVYFYIANYYSLAGEVRTLSKKQERLADVLVKAYNYNGDLIDSARSDSLGNYHLNLPYDQDFKLSAEKEGYETLDPFAFSTRGKPFGVDSLLLPMWKQNLFARGKIISNETESVLPGATVLLRNLTDGRMDSLVLNDKSEYVFLVRPNMEYRIEARKNGFIPNGFNLNTKGLVEGELLNDIVLEEIYIEKEVVLFEYDKYELTQEAIDQLDHIVRTLIKFRTATVNIGAHADARGTRVYNQRLSNNRAEAVVKYLKANSISKKRIEARGFGEELILNRCSDGVECTEEEHYKNRRGEVKVQKVPVN